MLARSLLLLSLVSLACALHVAQDSPPKSCYKAPVIAEADPDVLIYDQNAPCPPGQVYLSNAGMKRPSAPLVAAGAADTHTYVAARFNPTLVSSLAGNIGQCVALPAGGTNVATWQVTRGQCP
ncbi:hypothetical protein GUITHDRAFT_154396 [Guillardia theta CCMP2712]|uniref:Secreted protein n=2 Tax=Guillardia theta TaxID=55529 RepID=L1IUV3_GUITC|nr:hypothetical protein GUITHDRAFT_154396 [Guillardia theta CCMP2712]EKX39620.1 hypothetical protein GUITHDRAFT_154396 [Guillardia theta CCMP2712]|eukprot:XP_005826600.1 hypothetical protein GUITHDRAFT_154396 [Guillardia theta CCMP2712]